MTSSSSSSLPYTREQEESAQRVLTIAEKSLYDVLGVDRQATESDIKKAYRKSALKFHPDKNAAPTAERAFRTLNLAQEILSDLQSRQRYDTLGHAAAMRLYSQAEKGYGQTQKDDGSVPAWPAGWPQSISAQELWNHLYSATKHSVPSIFVFEQPIKIRADHRIITVRQLLLYLGAIVMMVTYFTVYGYERIRAAGLDANFIVAGPASSRSNGDMETFSELRHTTTLPGVQVPYYTTDGFTSIFGPALGKNDGWRVFERAVGQRYRLELAKLCSDELAQLNQAFLSNTVDYLSKQDTLSSCYQYQSMFLEKRNHEVGVVN
jgi:hypothetical protein